MHPQTGHILRKMDGPLAQRIKLIHLWIVGGAIFDTLIVTGFHAAGYVTAWVPLAYGAASAAVFGAAAWAHHSGLSQSFKDPTLYVPQALAAMLLPLALAMAAPQIGFLGFVILFGVSVYGFLATNRTVFVCGWSVMIVGVLAVVLINGPMLKMPTSTLAGTVLTCIALLGAQVRFIGAAAFTRSLQARIREKNRALNAAVERIELLASKDELTTLPNRRSVTQWLREQMAFSDRTELPLCVALLDIDHFKRINDVCGHQIGDQVLHMFATRASEATRVTDRLGRYGGEEFLLVLAATSLPEAEEVLQRIRAGVETCDWSPIDSRLRVTVTAGVAAYRLGEPIEALMKRADAALYQGKEAGRNRVVLDWIDAQRSRAGRNADIERIIAAQ